MIVFNAKDKENSNPPIPPKGRVIRDGSGKIVKK